MSCLRCHGMMVEATIFTQEGGTPMARCLNCGDIVDTVVISNRRRSLPSFCKKHGKKTGPMISRL